MLSPVGCISPDVVVCQWAIVGEKLVKAWWTLEWRGAVDGGCIDWVDHGGPLRCDQDVLQGLGGLGNFSKWGGWP